MREADDDNQRGVGKSSRGSGREVESEEEENKEEETEKSGYEDEREVRTESTRRSLSAHVYATNVEAPLFPRTRERIGIGTNGGI